MSDTTNSRRPTLALVWGLLTIVFIALKLTGYISWSWWWVLAPMWGGFALVMAFFVLAFLYFLVFSK